MYWSEIMLKMFTVFTRVVLLAAVVIVNGCSGNSDTAPVATSSSWYAPDGPNPSASQMETLFDAGQLYFNVSSTTNTSGEIRGQIVPTATTYLTDNGDPFAANPLNNPLTFATILSGDQVRPRNVVSTARGYGSITINPVTKQITGFLVASGISGSSARINDGLSGSSGTVVLMLSGGPIVWTVPAGTVLTDQQIARLKAGAYYFDVQSEPFPGGEIRGQLNLQVRSAALKGSSEVPPVATSATGATGVGYLAVNPITLAFTGFVKVSGLSSAVTLAAVQVGAIGVNGAPIITLTSNGYGIYSIPPNTVLSGTQLTSFNNDELYFNIHTQNNIGGELRGQILKSTIRIGAANLTGASQVPPVVTQASGTALIALNSVSEQISGSVSATGVNGTAVRLHSGSLTANGPALIVLSKSSPVIVSPASGVSFALDVQPIFSASCLSACHVTGGIAPLSLQPGLAYNNILTRVVPGRSSTSYLMDRLTGAVPPRMPLINAPLDAVSMDLVRAWIDNGALDN